MTNVYDQNAAVVLTATFTVGGVNTDPSTISLTYRSPDGTETTVTYAGGGVTKISTGVYSYTLIPTEYGSYVYAWDGTGADVAAITGSFFVRRQEA